MMRRKPWLPGLSILALLALGLPGCSDDSTAEPGGAGGRKTGGAGGAAGKAGGAGAAGKAGGGASGAAGQGGSVPGGSGQAGSSTFPRQAGGSGGSPGGAGAAGTSGGVDSAGGSAGTGAGGSGEAGQPGGEAGTGQAGAGQAGSPPVDCAGDPNVDNDGDGFTEADGDCNDCDANANPGAVDIITLNPDGTTASEQADEDCDGVTLMPGQDVCDQGLAIDDGDPLKGAFAMDICKQATGNSWGIVSAQYVKIDGQPLDASGAPGHGLLPRFGSAVLPQRGSSMFVVSSGAARNPEDPGYMPPNGFDRKSTDGAPPGFPLESPDCPGVTTGVPHDSTALRLVLKVPTNAKSFSFKFKFYTYEYPGYICSQYNDFFTVLMDPPPADVNQVNRNITFDKKGNPVSVNNAFLEVCACPGGAPGPCQVSSKTFECPAGAGELAGTGFDTFPGQSAATVWLETKAPVTPGSTITLTFGAFDSGDGVLDSTGLVDDFRWSAEPAQGTSTDKP